MLTSVVPPPPPAFFSTCPCAGRYVSEDLREEVLKMNANRTYAFAKDFVQMPKCKNIQCVGRKFIHAADSPGKEGGALFMRDLERIIDDIRKTGPDKMTIGMDISEYS